MKLRITKKNEIVSFTVMCAEYFLYAILYIILGKSGTSFLNTLFVVLISTMVFIRVFFIKPNGEFVIRISMLILIIEFVFDVFWRRGISVPWNVLYLFDFILILKLFGIIFIEKKVRKDCYLWCVFFILIIGSISAIYSGISFFTWIMTVRLYVRTVSIYYYVSYYELTINKNKIILFSLLNIILVPIEFFKFHQDDISGIFGARGNKFLLLVMTIVLSVELTKYFMKKIKLQNVILCEGIYVIICAIAEIKFGFILAIALPILYILIVNKSILEFINFRKIIVLVLTIILISRGIQILYKMYPDFSNFFSVEAITNYLMHSSNSAYIYGRFEVYIALIRKELNSCFEQLMGLGIGSAMPPDFWYISFYDLRRGITDNAISLVQSVIWNQYGYRSGYQMVSFLHLILETGIIGTCLYIIAIIGFIKKGLVLAKYSTKSTIRALGYSTIGFYVTWIVIGIYLQTLFDLRAGIIFAVYSGIITNIYYQTRVDEKKLKVIN